MRQHDIRIMTRADIAPVAASAARAFYDDPLQTWAIPDATVRLALLNGTFTILIEHLDLPYGLSYTDATRSVAAFWLPPARRPLEPDAIDALRALDDMLGEAAERFQCAQQAMDAARPPAPHFYLQGLATDPARQREGLGSAALLPMLTRCDAERAPAYLESTKETNVRFYERHGFVVTGTIDVPSGGPRLWPMWREPRPRRP